MLAAPTPATTLMMGNTYTMDLSSLWGRKRATAQTAEPGLSPHPTPHGQREGDETHRKEGRVKVPQNRGGMNSGKDNRCTTQGII